MSSISQFYADWRACQRWWPSTKSAPQRPVVPDASSDDRGRPKRKFLPLRPQHPLTVAPAVDSPTYLLHPFPPRPRDVKWCPLIFACFLRFCGRVARTHDARGKWRCTMMPLRQSLMRSSRPTKILRGWAGCRHSCTKVPTKPVFGGNEYCHIHSGLMG